MKLSVWQLSTVVLLSLLIGQNLTTRPSQAEAASQDVFGSPQVAVTTYRNQKGSFILWSDGHVSAVATPNTAVSLLTDCVDAPEVPQATRDQSKPQGSPNVPVGVYQNSTATYVLFADGSTKKPKGDASAASASPSVRSAQINGTSGAAVGDDSIKFSHTGSTGYYNLRFDPPFKGTPSVTITAASHHYVGGIQSVSASSCAVWTARLDGAHGWVDDNCSFVITAVGE